MLSTASFSAEIYSKDSTTIVVNGDIEAGDAAAVIALYQSSKFSTLELTSNGGFFDEAVVLGTFVYDNTDLSVKIDGNCYSACAFIALASKNIDLPSGSVIGIHLPYFDIFDNYLTSLDSTAYATWYIGHIGITQAFMQDLLKATAPQILVMNEKAMLAAGFVKNSEGKYVR